MEQNQYKSRSLVKSLIPHTCIFIYRNNQRYRVTIHVSLGTVDRFFWKYTENLSQHRELFGRRQNYSKAHTYIRNKRESNAID